jgi:hypothetical protein
MMGLFGIAVFAGSLRPGGNFEIPSALPPTGTRYCDRN